MTENSNLKTALLYFQISNADLAKAVGIDPSLISRYISGSRKLKKNSKQAEEITEYLLSRADTVEKIDWLTEQFEQANLPTDTGSVLGIKQNLTLWISSDGDLPAEAAEESGETEEVPEGSGKGSRTLETGVQAITETLWEALRQVSSDNSVDVFLTSDRLRIFTDGVFASMLHQVLADRKIRMNVVICISGDTRHLSRMVQEYMGEMITGTMKFYTYFGAAETITEQMFCILEGKVAVIITESPSGSAQPVGTFLTDTDFAQELRRSFDGTYRYSQSMFNIYDDNYVRTMIEALYCEYCIPGNLCVVKDSINPMFMTYEAYCRVLRISNEDDGEYTWKCNEYRRFNEGFDGVLRNGSICREIISLKRLKTIVRDRKCRMAGLYFLGTGFFELDLQGCRDIVAGYIDYLNRFPNFSLLILDELPELHNSNCWHVKEGQSVAINDWNGPAPIMCHSGNRVLVQEFQRHYEAVWERGTGSLPNRAYVISILKGILREMDQILAEDAAKTQ